MVDAVEATGFATVAIAKVDSSLQLVSKFQEGRKRML